LSFELKLIKAAFSLYLPTLETIPVIAVTSNPKADISSRISI
jgi:hypothetical protein